MSGLLYNTKAKCILIKQTRQKSRNSRNLEMQLPSNPHTQIHG